jgi:putative tryptophan/tyrosine transport system substrate-binding protein
MRRREFIALLGSAAATWPLAARAQQSPIPSIGFVNAGSSQGLARSVSSFLKGLGETGYAEGHNIAIEYRWAESQIDKLPALVADLIDRQVKVIAAGGTPAALAAKAATTTIPIVFETGGDPIKLGLVDRLNRPGGTVTGVTQANNETTPKRLQLLHELLPGARVIGLLVNPTDPALADADTSAVLEAAHTLGVEVHVLNAATDRDFDGIFAKLTELKADGLVIGGEQLFTSHVEQLAALTVRYAVPAAYQWRAFAVAGGLLSYGSDVIDAYRVAGLYTGRILKGEKPSDLPIQQATKFELYINLHTAKALGITVPVPLLGRADEVIE